MYEGYFQLQRRPFSATPDSKCFFASPEVQEAFDELLLRIDNGQGVGVLTAGAGIGKTLLCRRLAVELAGRYTALFLGNANFPTRRALLQAILFEMDRRYSGMEEQELRLELIAALKELSSSGRSALLIIDEAHLLNDRLLEEVRTLATLSHEDQPLVRVVLSGQLSLEEKLADPALEALNQRLACHVYLEPLTRQQCREYIAYRMNWAGGDAARTFTDEALEAIAHACNGLPRCLNQLCDHCLLLAYVAEQQQVTRETVADALSDLKQLPLHWNESLPASSPLAALSAVSPSSQSLDADRCLGAEVELEGLETEQITGAAAPVSPPVCIEVGAEPAEQMETAPESIDESGHVDSQIDDVCETAPISGVGDARVPWQKEAPVLHSPIEEVIHDRYALLDARSLRLVGTFSDQGAIAVTSFGVSPDAHRTADRATGRREPVRTSESDPVVAEDSGSRDSRPDRIIDEVLPLLEDAGRSGFKAASEDAPGGWVDFESARAEDEDLEELIGSDVLDVCLDVQRSLGNWGDEAVVGGSAMESDVSDTSGILFDSPVDEYDVVEPEFEELPPRTSGNRIAEIAAVDRGTDARAIPRPEYRRIFSTLRRRMAREKGRL
jgi:type II secretory pathway predicted ATPase ExeA